MSNVREHRDPGCTCPMCHVFHGVPGTQHSRKRVLRDGRGRPRRRGGDLASSHLQARPRRHRREGTAGSSRRRARRFGQPEARPAREPGQSPGTSSGTQSLVNGQRRGTACARTTSLNPKSFTGARDMDVTLVRCVCRRRPSSRSWKPAGAAPAGAGVAHGPATLGMTTSCRAPRDGRRGSCAPEVPERPRRGPGPRERERPGGRLGTGGPQEPTGAGSETSGGSGHAIAPQ